MDDLQFRRHAYDDPNSQDEDFLAQIAASESDAKLVSELKTLDSKLTHALNIDVPNDLADKLLLRQQLNKHQEQKKHTRYLMAMAASVALVIGLSFSMLKFAPVDLAEHALAHVYHEPKSMLVDQNVGFEDVNFKLAGIGGLENAKFIQQPGKVFYTSYCDFQGVKSLHLVMEGKDGKVTLFIVPAENRMVTEEAFADQHYQGLGFQTAGAFMMLVAEQDTDLQFVKSEIEQTFI
ncbi:MULTISPECIES: DUF3379 domain-containing protein [unclassified Shewanella]|uniref:DUF3379 domain-containing protein n=1 Tax=unclassified Shewanella TaxID=196818 RepID=UPI000C8443CC|nr:MULTISPECIES: DUF3379 domain-containing protein [unclassified Shewanella]MDO6617712.1 DUF3379 domain-containing protein [Shewanella sp. 6_MG-2023]MDO6678362.1 DUF3379 domain-containing protein [Shewanella sp. 4_MG-2023]MDO6776252.1 DUF3379 domain-containing protein [Shewanella sp. 3_MG-2023]PMG31100.1 hypothetical protein BCU94_09090 [Shewanella sp. 10N.286.52.C2]PMG51775.1 hypothetical protein BCU91_16090 [Shewanella sp. 10N.286.52.B9]